MALLRIPAPPRSKEHVARWPAFSGARSRMDRAIADLRQPVHPTYAGLAAAAISLLGLVSTAFVPETPAREHTATEEFFTGVFVGVFAMGCIATWIGCVIGRRWGLFAALPVSFLMLLSAVTCPLSGHHTFGLWVLGATGAAGLGVFVNLAAIRVVRPLSENKQGSG